MKTKFFTLFLIISSLSIFGQPQMQPNTGIIVGKMTDNQQNPLQYVNVFLHKQADSSVIQAVATDAEGKFMFSNVPYGNYFLEFKFLGFKNKTLNNIKVSKDNRFVKIGKVTLDNDDTDIGEVVVQGQTSTVQYKIDKKVINVSQDISASGGDATDALRNVPSVDVDVNGDVTLRGSSNFTVMINGKPTILDANDALKQIPASNIEKIEIITNPSAKYDPDGDAGIINIITKNKEDDGISGKIEVGGDNNLGYKGDILLNYKKRKFSLMTEISLQKRIHPMDFSQYTETYISQDTFFKDYSGAMSRGHAGASGKFGVSYNFNDKNNLSFNVLAGKRGFMMSNEQKMESWFASTNNHFYSLTDSKFKVMGDQLESNIDYEHKFNDKGHKLKTYVQYSIFYPQKENNMSIDTTDAEWNVINSDEGSSIENIDRKKLRFQADYELPINEKTKLEAGAVYRMLDVADTYTSDLPGQPQINSNFTFNRQIFGYYTTFASSLKKVFDYQLGMRLEYTDRTIIAEETYPLQRLDFFPTVHLSKHLPFDQQIQAGYSRRINRPRGWNLSPTLIYMDQTTARKGNPALKPEYANAFEVNYIKNFGKNYISIETYYKITENKFDRIMSTDSTLLIFTTENLNKDYSLGSEISANLVVLKMIRMNISTNLYQYRITGTLDGQPVDKQTFTWSSRAMMMTMLPTGTILQFGGFYKAPTVTLQGNMNPIFMTFGGIRQSFFKRKLNLTIQFNDIFSTMKYSFTNSSDYLYSTAEYAFAHPTIGFTLSYIIRNYKDSNRGGYKNGSDNVDFMGEGDY